MTAWNRKSGELAVASGRDFERLSLPLLRLFWPDLIHPRELAGLDRAGIDLVVWADSGEFPVVVQCKGLYQEEKIVSAQLPQIKKSIESFKNSNFTCHTYLLLHNRTGEDRAAHDIILEHLKDLVYNGKAINAVLWDRQTFIKQLKRRLKEEIANRIVRRAQTLVEANKRIFRFGGVHVDPVPMSFENWGFGHASTIERDLSEPSKLSPSQVLGARKRTKWTLLIGHFGLGKSTFALHAAGSVAQKLVYVHSSELPGIEGSVGTNFLMQEVLRAHPLFDEFDDSSAHELNSLGGTLLRELLSKNEPEFSLVIDGLDESKKYSSAQGLVKLTNELEELRCPKILVTRKEHFETTFGNFKNALSQMALDDMSVKAGNKRQARICCLEEWTDIEVVGFLKQCCELGTEAEKIHINTLIDSVKNGSLDNSVGGLLRHPLFLQMMVSIASEGNQIPENPALLIDRWLELKIHRDINAQRPVPWKIKDVDVFVEEINEAMSEVALVMTETRDNHIEIREEISETELCDKLTDLGHTDVDVSHFINVSLLVPTLRRKGSALNFKFYHRVLQEYLLARKWYQNTPQAHIPNDVSYWINMLRQQ